MDIQSQYNQNAQLENFRQFKVSDKNHYEYKNVIKEQDWEEFIQSLKNTRDALNQDKLKPKDIIILRLYVNFMDVESLQQQANNETDP